MDCSCCVQASAAVPRGLSCRNLRGLQRVKEQRAVALAYFDALDKMALIRKDLRDVITPPVEERPVIPNEEVNYEEYERLRLLRYESLNTRQKAAAVDIIDALDRPRNRCIFIDGPGGSGKTYLYNNVYDIAIGRRKKVGCVAWTGIAADLLPGGRTVNSLLLEPELLNETTTKEAREKEQWTW
uniref:ATP-dependent DNA helicase n=1 Tax=Haemonchus contortus TaxID=6289 RepID=A0A7I4Z6N0_HAECO